MDTVRKRNKVEKLRYLIVDVAYAIDQDLEVSRSNKTFMRFRFMHIKTEDQ